MMFYMIAAIDNITGGTVLKSYLDQSVTKVQQFGESGRVDKRTGLYPWKLTLSECEDKVIWALDVAIVSGPGYVETAENVTDLDPKYEACY